MFNSTTNLTSEVNAMGVDQIALQFQLALLSFVGTTGNALVLFVFRRTKDELVSTIFIMALAWVDLMTCSVVIPFTMYMEYIDFHIGNDIACKFYEFLVTSHMQFSALIMVCIAVDRYVCICRPLATLFTTANAKTVSLLTALTAAVLGLFPSLNYGVYAVNATLPTHLLYQLNVSTSLHHVPDLAVVATESSSTSMEFERDSRVDEEPSTDRDAIIAAFCQNLWDMMQAGDPDKLLSFNCPVVSVVYTGHCIPTAALLGKGFYEAYGVCYHAIFVTCLLTAFVLYAFTYRSVLRHRAGQQKRRSRCVEMVVLVNRQSDRPPDARKGSITAAAITETRRQSSTWCRERIDSFFSEAARRSYARYRANARTAAILFVVTLVFAVCYTPALLSLWSFIGHNNNVFYLYFANNASNPIIYSFMNRNFRDNLKTALKKTLKRNQTRI